MPVIFHTLDSKDSIPDTLKSSTLSTPLLSARIFNDVPFKPDENDHISLTMRTNKVHRHEWNENSLPRPAANVRPDIRRHKTQTSRPRHRPRNLRKTNSLPSVQPRFGRWTVETFETSEDTPQKARRWTVPSKAASTYGISTLVPVDETPNRSDGNARATFHTDQSPAMITLRRATTSKPRKYSMTLTSFPTPKFSRDNSGLLTSFLCSITGSEEVPAKVRKISTPGKTSVPKPRGLSVVSTENDFRPTISAVAPPVQSEVVAMEPRLSDASLNPKSSSLRRCSTRFVSENVAYEILWDDNWTTSSQSSASAAAGMPPGQAKIVPSRELAGAKPLERRLSNALSRSRRASSQTATSRRASYAPIPDSSSQSIWANPNISRLFEEQPANDRWPRSGSLKRSNVCPSLLRDVDVGHRSSRSMSRHSKFVDHVEFFPPLRSRVNTTDDGPPASSMEETREGTRETVERRESAMFPSKDGERGRTGSLVGISSHTKRKSVTDRYQPRRQSFYVGNRRAGEGRGRGRAEACDDGSAPLLGAD